MSHLGYPGKGSAILNKKSDRNELKAQCCRMRSAHFQKLPLQASNHDHLGLRLEDWHMQSNINGLPEIGFVRERQILRVFPVSRSTWWNGVRDGKYPKPVKLSDRITAWRVSDIRALIEAKSEAGKDRNGNRQG